MRKAVQTVRAAGMVLFLGSALATGISYPTSGSAWTTRIIDASGGRAGALVVEAGGDAIVGGSLGGTLPLFAVVRLAGSTGAELWRYTIPTSTTFSAANALAVDAEGNVIAVGELDRLSGVSFPKFTTVKISGTTGTQLWRRDIPAAAKVSVVFASSVAIDGAGDAVVAGTTQYDPDDRYATYWTVVKYAGTDGTQLWRTDLEGTDYAGGNTAWAIDLDGAGDVYSAGNTTNASYSLGGGSDFTVVKLSGATGIELWRRVIGGTRVDPDPTDHDVLDQDVALAVRADGSGNVVATGFLANDTTGSDLAVVKLDGSDGTEIWRQEITGTANESSDSGSALVFDAAGNVVVTGRTEGTTSGSDLAVFKLAAADGTEIWQRVIDGTPEDFEVARSVDIDSAGDVVVAGALGNAGTAEDLVVVKLSGADGTEIWRRAAASGDSVDVGFAVGLDAAGDVFASGATDDFNAFTSLKLDGDSGTDHQPITGRQLLVRDKADATSRRKLVVTSKDKTRIVPPLPASQGDPTISGAVLTLSNPTTTDSAEFSLPASNWTALGSPPGKRGYRYRSSSGPCGVVDVRPGKLKARCGGQEMSFALDDPEQGSLAVTLTTGGATAANRYCALFGGTVRIDRPAVGSRTGLFRAKDAPLAPSCP